MADATTEQVQPDTGGTKDAAYWEAEAKKAFDARQKAKEKADELAKRLAGFEGFDPDEYKALKSAAEKAEEDRKKKAGEFESLKQQLADKHTKEIQDRDQKLSSLSERFKNTVKRAEFGAATDYFNGSDASKTILDVDLGMSALGKYVDVEDTDDDIGYRVIVKTPKGDTILGKDGNPAPFADAIGELIALLPNRDRILRGSGKTGSGSSGGSNSSPATVDVSRPLTRSQMSDPKVREALKRKHAEAGGLVMGSAWDKR